MIKSLTLFFKHVSRYLLFLIAIYVLPLWLFFQFSPLKVPYIQVVFVAGLIVSQYFLFKEKAFRKKVESSVKGVLRSERGRIPSQKEIINRTGEVIKFRGLSIILVALIQLFLILFYQYP